MPLPTPRPRERYQLFIRRFMKNTEAKQKFPDINQRFAVGVSQWRNK